MTQPKGLARAAEQRRRDARAERTCAALERIAAALEHLLYVPLPSTDEAAVFVKRKRGGR